MAEMTVADAFGVAEHPREYPDRDVEVACIVLATEVRRLQDRESTLQASVMAHKTWEDEAVGQANNANLAYNKMRVERDALKAEVERLTRERAAAVEAAFREGWSRKAGMPCGIDCGYKINAAWAASTAKRECER